MPIESLPEPYDGPIWLLALHRAPWTVRLLLVIAVMAAFILGFAHIFHHPTSLVPGVVTGATIVLVRVFRFRDVFALGANDRALLRRVELSGRASGNARADDLAKRRLADLRRGWNSDRIALPLIAVLSPAIVVYGLTRPNWAWSLLLLPFVGVLAVSALWHHSYRPGVALQRLVEDQARA